MKCPECGTWCEKMSDLPWICPACGWEEGDETYENWEPPYDDYGLSYEEYF